MTSRIRRVWRRELGLVQTRVTIHRGRHRSHPEGAGTDAQRWSATAGSRGVLGVCELGADSSVAKAPSE